MSLLAQLYALRWVLLSAVLVVYVADKYRKYNRLRQFDGPFGTGWSEFWHSRVILGLRSHLAYKDVNDKYGKKSISAEVVQQRGVRGMLTLA
jgi:SH3-like domain-containing protein